MVGQPHKNMRTTELYTSNEQIVRYVCGFYLNQAIINKEKEGKEKWAESLPLRKMH